MHNAHVTTLRNPVWNWVECAPNWAGILSVTTDAGSPYTRKEMSWSQHMLALCILRCSCKVPCEVGSLLAYAPQRQAQSMNSLVNAQHNPTPFGHANISHNSADRDSPVEAVSIALSSGQAPGSQAPRIKGKKKSHRKKLKYTSAMPAYQTNSQRQAN